MEKPHTQNSDAGTQPLVTISIPLYKCEDFIVKCLDSVFAQTYQNLEVTLINDQTPDNAVEIAENYIRQNQLENWKIYHLEKNSGLSVVRNKGIDTAQGKYLFFLDSDDSITPDCIGKLVEISEEYQLQMSVGSVIGVNIETGEESQLWEITETENVLRGNDKIFRSFIDGKYPISSWNKLVLLSFIKENKLYFTPGLFAQDVLQSFYTAEVLESIGFVKDITYIYNLHENSVTQNRNQRHFDNWETILLAIEKVLKKSTGEKSDLIKSFMVGYKTGNLHMNWKAQFSDDWWLYSFRKYKKIKDFTIADFASKNFTTATKKNALKLKLPPKLALRFFKHQFYA